MCRMPSDCKRTLCCFLQAGRAAEGGCHTAARLHPASRTMVDEAAMDLVRTHMQDVRVPAHHDKV